MSPNASTTSIIEETIIAPQVVRTEQTQLVNAGPRYWEDDYLLPPLTDNEVARVPPPKDTLMYFNDDPALGGETWRVPVPSAPMSDFNAACKVTPMSDDFNRVIPWDHQKKDYVYGAVDDHIFRGRYDRRRLKRKLDHVKQQGSWDPTSSYNKCCLCCLIVGALLLALWLLAWAYRPYHWWCGFFGNTWIWFLLPLFILMILITWCCICKAAANHATRNRSRYIRHALDDVNDRHLKGSGVQMKPGVKAAWLEVDMDPNRTEIYGDVIDDFRLYNGEDHVKMVEMEVERREDMDARAQIPIENRPKREAEYVQHDVVEEVDIVDNSYVQQQSYVRQDGPLVVENAGYVYPERPATTVVEQTVVNTTPGYNAPAYVSNQSYVSNPSVVSNPGYVSQTVVTNNNQMSFYDRLKASKATGNTLLLSGQGNVNEISRFNESGDESNLSYYEKLKRAKKEGNKTATYQSELPEPL